MLPVGLNGHRRGWGGLDVRSGRYSVGGVHDSSVQRRRGQEWLGQGWRGGGGCLDENGCGCWNKGHRDVFWGRGGCLHWNRFHRRGLDRRERDGDGRDSRRMRRCSLNSLDSRWSRDSGRRGRGRRGKILYGSFRHQCCDRLAVGLCDCCLLGVRSDAILLGTE